jgi:hypothetical protein
MNVAYPYQRFQDWFTQQWVILRGRKIDPETESWLVGPFGGLNGIGEEFILQLAEKEKLVVHRKVKSTGLLSSVNELGLSESDLAILSKEVIAFYEQTGRYKLSFRVKWKRGFKFFGGLVNSLFSDRIHQLYIPTKNIDGIEVLDSEIITLNAPNSNEPVFTIWFRRLKTSGKVIFSGVYGTCTLPSGKKCVKAVFPLPNGNATVILEPIVQQNGALALVSSGDKFGDPGFYFLLKDSKNNYWAQYIQSFRDRLTINILEDYLSAEQILTLWGREVLRINYKIDKEEEG